MASIFDLPSNTNQLESANQGCSKMMYNQHAPTRDVTRENWANGAIHVRFQTSGATWWVPNRSYLRFRFELSKADGSPLELQDEISPSMNLCSTLFQSCEFRINDTVVSRIADYLPQVDTLDKRIHKSGAWLDSIGASTGLWQDDFLKRLSVVAVDADDSVRSTKASSKEQIGYAAADTVSVAVDTGVATFSAGDANVSFQVGDTLVVAGNKYNISEILTATTVQLNNQKGLAIAATADFSRERSTVSKQDDSRKVKSFECVWQPTLSIFKIAHALPNCKFELVLNPQTSAVYQKSAVESLLGAGDKQPNLRQVGAPSAGSEYKLQIVDMYLYANVVEGPRCDDSTFLIDLDQTRAQSESIDNRNFSQVNLDVSPSTYGLTVAYQDLRAGTDTQYSATKFKSYGSGGAAAGDRPADEAQDLKLNRFFLQYAGQKLPGGPDADPIFQRGGVDPTDFTAQRYVESQMYSGAYFDSGAAEKIETWQKRGPYQYYAIPRDGTDRSTRVNVHQGFAADTDVKNMRMLLFDHSKQIARIQIADSRCVDVQVEDA